MPDFARLDNYLAEHRDRFEEDLCELLRIPSISTDPTYAQNVRQAGVWMYDVFQKMGLSVQLVETAGNPLVIAESPPVPGKPVALVYGHYDVQPPDPLHEWTSPPFEPTRRDGNLYARGASDDKGQMLTHVQSVQAWLESEGELPIQVKFVIEGEEEIGSANLTQYLATQGKALASDVVVISDCSQFAPGRPAITYGLKGIAYFELRLDGPKQDLHSGSFGGAVANPANVLCQMLAAVIDENGKIKIPGFYDKVVPLTDSERLEFASLPFDERAFVSQLGVSGLSGETGYSTLERRWARPTFDVSGLTSGYQGDGAKTVLPAWASAKFSFRLVPNQNPQDISQALEAMLNAICPPGIRMSLRALHGGEGFLVSCDNPYMTAAARAIEKGFRNPPVFIREGGSIPVVTAFHQQLGAVVLLLGWGLNDDNLHSPDEKFSLADFHRGIKASTYLWHELSRIDHSADTLKSTI